MRPKRLAVIVNLKGIDGEWSVESRSELRVILRRLHNNKCMPKPDHDGANVVKTYVDDLPWIV